MRFDKRLQITTLAIASAFLALAALTRAAPPAFPGPPSALPGAPTFNKDIAPIIFSNCSSCHRLGEVAPFSLLTFEDVSQHARQMVRVTRDRLMPPWKPEPNSAEFLDEHRLTDQQIDTIRRWVDGDKPRGNAADLPPQPKFTDGWQLGKPDLILKMADEYTIPADGRDVFRCFVMPITVPAGQYVKAVEFRPGNRSVVHHALFYLDTSGTARVLDAKDPAPGYSGFGGPGFVPTGALGGWAPGAVPRPFPDGIARRIAANCDLVFQVHYHPTGKQEKDQSTLGVYFTSTPPTRFMLPIVLGSRDINIAPGDKSYTVTDSYTLPIDMQALGITPHAHLICREMVVNAILPDGKVQSLIWIKNWDFNWQGQYQYKTPVVLPAGTKLEMKYTYDNSVDNPRNPNTPPVRITYGEQTTNEMAFCFLQAAPVRLLDLPALVESLRTRSVARTGRLFDSAELQTLLNAIGARARRGGAPEPVPGPATPPPAGR